MEAKQTLLIVQIVVAVLLMIVILLQSGGAGLGNVFGGGGGEFFRSKRGVEKFLYNATIFLSVVFALNSLALGYVYRA